MRASRVALLLLGVTATLAITLTTTDYDVKRTIPGNSYQGITFTPNGDLWMSSGSAFCVFANAANLPNGGTIAQNTGRCGNSNVGATNIVSSQTGRIYTVNGHEINPTNFAGTRRWNDCGATHGIALDPRDGAIFVASVGNGRVWRIPNPDASTGQMTIDCSASMYFDAGSAGLGGFDGIAIGPDGTFYGAGYTANRFIIVEPWTPSAPRGLLRSAKPTTNTSPDGISICDSNGNSFALIMMTSGKIARFALSGPGGAPVYQEDVLATNVGGYLDFSAVDPYGCIWGTVLSGGQGVFRVTNFDGSCGCASAQVPDPCPETEKCAKLSDVVHSRVVAVPM